MADEQPPARRQHPFEPGGAVVVARLAVARARPLREQVELVRPPLGGKRAVVHADRAQHPAGQAAHMVTLLAPDVKLYVPAGQGWHAVELLLARVVEYVPRSHSVQ